MTELLDNLLGWLRKSLSDGSGAMVARKLTSALVTFFLHFPHHWPQCIKGLGFALSSQGPPQGTLREPVALLDVLPTLDSPRLRALLWFAAALVEEAGKADMNSSNQ